MEIVIVTLGREVLAIYVRIFSVDNDHLLQMSVKDAPECGNIAFDKTKPHSDRHHNNYILLESRIMVRYAMTSIPIAAMDGAVSPTCGRINCPLNSQIRV
jgi:hypothetical protein